MEPTPFTLQNLRKQHASLEGQIRDLEWRLEQESKAYHKVSIPIAYHRHTVSRSSAYHQRDVSALTTYGHLG